MTTELSQSELLQNFEQSYSCTPHLVHLFEGKNETASMTHEEVFYKFTTTLQIPYHVDYANKITLSVTVDITKPIKPWKPATPGTVEEFSGLLVKVFPVLGNISDDELDDIIDDVRNKSEN
jgi:hypothetical protein